MLPRSFCPVLVLCLLLLCLQLPPLCALAARDAVPEISDYGWKFLVWGMSPQQTKNAFRMQGQNVTLRELPAMNLLAGFDHAWQPLELPAESVSGQAGGLLLATDFNGAVLLFRNGQLFGVYISRASPRYIQDSLFSAIVRRYPEGRHHSQGQGRTRFQHFAGNRRIVWEGRPSGFTLAFYDPARMPPESVPAVPLVRHPERPVLSESPEISRQSSAPFVNPHPNQGATWREPDIGMDFIFLPGGCFLRSLPDQRERQEVCVEPFWISTREVSEQEFADCKAFDAPAVNEQVESSSLPAAGMSRLQALEFTDCLDRRHPGRDFALPTAAQWEFAARAGSLGTAPWPGYEAACEFGNFADQSATASAPQLTDVFPCDDGYAGRAPVGSFPPNDWGLYDLLGNVREWCFPSQHDLGSDFVACGGSFASGPAETGYFSRLQGHETQGREDVGLRVVFQETEALAPRDFRTPPSPGFSDDSLWQPPIVKPPSRELAPGKRPAIEDLM